MAEIQQEPVKGRKAGQVLRQLGLLGLVSGAGTLGALGGHALGRSAAERELQAPSPEEEAIMTLMQRQALLNYLNGVPS